MEKLNNNLNIMLSILFIVHFKNIYKKKCTKNTIERG